MTISPYFLSEPSNIFHKSDDLVVHLFNRMALLYQAPRPCLRALRLLYTKAGRESLGATAIRPQAVQGGKSALLCVPRVAVRGQASVVGC